VSADVQSSSNGCTRSADGFESSVVGELAEGPKFLLVGRPAEYNVMPDRAKTG
jgi:hypothetical protein